LIDLKNIILHKKMSYTSGGIVWTNNPAFSLLNDGAAFPKELIQAPKYGEIATNLVFAGAFVAGTAVSLVNTENDLCDMQDNVSDMQDTLNNLSTTITTIDQATQEEYQQIFDDINKNINDSKLYSQQITQLQNSAISKKIIAVVLVFVFNLSIIGSLLIKRLLAKQNA
jgi:hypothetical protein